MLSRARFQLLYVFVFVMLFFAVRFCGYRFRAIGTFFFLSVDIFDIPFFMSFDDVLSMISNFLCMKGTVASERFI